MFDTGNKHANMIQLDFAKLLNSETLELRDDVIERPTFRRRLAAKFWTMLGKPHRIRGGYSFEWLTIDGSPVEIVGILRDARWVGEEVARCTQGIRFNNKFETSDFLVVKNLVCNAIFSLDTINELRLRGRCSAGLFQKKPTPAGKFPTKSEAISIFFSLHKLQ